VPGAYIRGGDGDDSLRAGAVSASHRCRFDADCGAGTRGFAKPVDASGPVAGVFSMGVFASCRFLPRPMFAVGVWYLAAGVACVALGGAERTFSPWAMGIPFGIGQLLVARSCLNSVTGGTYDDP